MRTSINVEELHKIIPLGFQQVFWGREADTQTMNMHVVTGTEGQRKKSDRYHQGLCGFKD